MKQRSPEGKTDGLLPHNLEAERSVLGSIIIDNGTLPKAREILCGEDFYRQPHGKIFAGMERLFTRSVAIDEVTLKEELARSGDLDAVGGPAYVAALADGVPSAENIEYYARIVKEKAVLRAIVHENEAVGLAVAARNGSPPGEDLQDIEAALKNLMTDLESLGSECAGNLLLEPLDLTTSDPAAVVPVTFGDPSGEVLQARGDFTVAAGSVGAGKSLFIQAACASLSAGAPLAGFPCPAKGRGLLVAGDGDGAEAVKRRVSRLLRGLWADPADSHNLQVYAPEGFNLEDSRSFSALQAILSDFDPDLLALDSWVSIAGPRLDHSNAAEVQAFIASRLRPLQLRPDETRRDLLLAAHLRKRQPGPGANSLQDRVAGSYYVLGGADACVGIEASGSEGFVCRVVKRSRTGAMFQPFGVRIEGQWTEPLRLVNVGHLKASQAELGEDENRILETMVALQVTAHGDGWIRLAEVKHRLGVTREDKRRSKALERAAARLEKSGRIEEHSTVRRTYRLPREGPDGDRQDILFDPEEG